MSKAQINVKLSTRFPSWSYKRQTSNSSGVWGNLKFYIDDENFNCDWWVVFGGLTQTQKAKCYSENTILITDEPSSIKKYAPEFIKQFNTIITIQKNIEAPNVINKQLLPWYIGAYYNKTTNKFDRFDKSYDELKKHNIEQKTKLISIISSNKNKTLGHKQRLKFIKKIKKHFGGKIDIYGLNSNNIPDKWNAIAPYKYHIVIENSVEEDYWTEKLADAYLAESYPIYYGCPNINEYFNTKSLTTINILKPKEAIKTIEKIIYDNYYNKFQDEIHDSKEKILDYYQIFPELHKIINGLEKERKNGKKKYITLYPEKIIEDTIINKNIGKLGIILKKINPNLYLKIKRIWKKIIQD